MKNENGKLAYIKAFISLLDHQTKVPAKVFLSSYFPGFEVCEQKPLLAELKKRKLIKNYVWEDGDFVITKPSRSGIIAFLCEIEKHPTQLRETEPIDTKIRFSEATGLITIGKLEPCPIPINTNQYFLCKVLFQEKFGKAITETDIVDMADWAKDTKRSVYDAMLAVNKRIKEYFDIEKFIRWKTGRVWINYKQN